MKIKVFIWSFTISANRDALNLAYDYHYFWQGEKNYHIYQGFMNKIWSRGRIPDYESAQLMDRLQSLGFSRSDVQVYDVSSLFGRIYAIIFGVWKFPALIIEKKKAQGIDACLKLLQDNVIDEIDKSSK